MHGEGLTVQRAEKCPYCDSYFLKNSSDFQRHIWAHQGVIQTHVHNTASIKTYGPISVHVQRVTA